MASAALVGIALTGCGSDGAANSTAAPASTASASADLVAAPAGFTGELIINRQRDLLDRGLINVLTHNQSDHELVVTTRQLVAEHFDTEPAAPRTSRLPVGGDVAIQVPYGTTNNCTDSTPVRAWLRVTFTVDGATEPQAADVELGGTDILDTIRAKQCASQTFHAAASAEFTNVVEQEGTLATDLVITRTSGDSTFEITYMGGTVLVGVQPPGGGQFVPVTIDRPEPVTIPVTFVVNRCDPHALAEVTKRYGLNLDMVIDGQPAQTVPIDVTTLVPQLEAIVEQCRASHP